MPTDPKPQDVDVDAMPDPDEEGIDETERNRRLEQRSQAVVTGPIDKGESDA
jgi:hypothetical protein